MRLYGNWLTHLTVLLAVTSIHEARRVRVQHAQDDDIQYYDPQERAQQVVLVSSDDYNGLYGQQAASRSSQENYPRQRLQEPALRESKTKDSSKSPPVQTIRNYNKVNDDGSFTFGYEAADGSFKEETRGTDCVVRGKYGYIDPDGNKREFTYVSGNPCDPNAKSEESEEKPDEDSNEPENIPANYPIGPIRPLPRPTSTVPPPPPPKPTVTVFQNTYEEANDEIEQPEPEQVLRPTLPPVRHRVLPARPAYVPEERPAPVIVHQRPRIYPQTTPPPVYREEPVTIAPRPVTIAPRPQPTPTPARQLPPTTYRPQLLQVAVTPRPALVYTKQVTPQRTTHYPSSTPASITHSSALDFAAEFQRFQQDNQIHPSTPSPIRTAKPATLHTNVHQTTSNPIYSSELVFDPSSGQYNTAVYQTLPQTEGDFSLNHRIQPYVHQAAPQLVSLRDLQQQSPLYRPVRPNQAAYQQSQADLQFQNSQQLFAQQQRARTQGHKAQAQPQQFYYIQPSIVQSQSGLAGGQIDAFLRGHNIQF